ncbi:MAG TPA: ABC transporter permease [Solirubrobacteraceae bacterium]|jgi:putative ABC transport system permease protein|nr:ABC transporter permease [Solirubrobacteraceae bacterium]
MKPANVARLYGVRLRARLAQECLAVVGIAAGVALLFASQVSSASLQSSVAALTRGIAGSATLQLVVRGPQGLPASTLARVRAIPGVRTAAPLLEVDANASGPRGSTSVELVGADGSLAKLGGALVRHTRLTPFGGFGAVVLPAPLANALGVTKFGQEARFQIGGRTSAAPLYEQLHARQIGTLIDTPVALAPLSYAQELAGMRARVSRILVRPAPGAQASVRAALTRLAGSHLNVEPVGYEQTLFEKAAAASNQSTALFAAVSALVGFLFAFNAVLFTAPQRRRLIADLRREGYGAPTVAAVLLLDALALGALACALGLALGQELSIHLFHSNPAFLSLAFALGSARTVGWQSIAFAVGGGMLAAALAVLIPLRTPRTVRTVPLLASSLTAAACLAGASAILLAAPDAALPGMVLTVAALLLALPLALGAALALVGRAAGRVRSPVAHVAAMELRAAGARALAIAATGAVAVFGSVAIDGAHGDLLAGLEGASRELNASTAVWVAPTGGYDLLHTAPFAPTLRTRLARLPGVRAVALYRSDLLDYGTRRVLALAPPPAALAPLLAGQLVEGNPRRAAARLRAGGWAVVSRALAAEHHLRMGDPFTLPTPTPRRLRVAALATNLGWEPGAIVLGGNEYTRAWGSNNATAYSVTLAPNTTPAAGVREIERALGPSSRSGWAVQTAEQHAAAQSALSRRALARLTQIAALIPIAAALAMVAAIGALVWERRPRLAKLKLEGLARGELWRTILLECALLLGVGFGAGALFGLYGQRLADRALGQAINFPVAHAAGAPAGLVSLALVAAAALLTIALPGYLATDVPAALALQE